MHIRREHHFTHDEVRQKVDELAADLKGRFGLRSHWEGDQLIFDGSGARGNVILGEDYVELDVKLGFALKLMEPTLRAIIEESLDDHIRNGLS